MVAVKVVSACYVKVLFVIKQHDLDMCRCPGKQHNVGWYNVADTGIFTQLCQYILVSLIKFPTSLSTLKLFNFRTMSVPPFHTSSKQTFYKNIGIVSSRSSLAASTNSETH